MYIKFICLSLATLAVLQDVDGKRTKKKHINDDATESTPQPNVVTYSTFGFKDVGGYDGFMPSSPDYATYLTGNNRDSSTRLYAPAFPSSLDSTGLGSYYDPQPDVTSLSITSDGFETHVKPYQPTSVSFFTAPNYDSSGDQNKNTGIKEYEPNSFNSNSPIYGTKLTSKNKNKNFNNINHTDYNIYNSVSSVINGNSAFEDNVSNNYPILSYDNTGGEKVLNISPSLESTPLKFPKVVDFTNVKNYYPTSIDYNKYKESLNKPYTLDNLFNKAVSDTNSNMNENKKYNDKDKEQQTYKNKWRIKDANINTDKVTTEDNSFKNDDTSDNYPNTIGNFKKYKFKNDYKDKVKNKQWNFGSYNNAINTPENTMKGYEYSTNYSNTSFKYDSDFSKRPFNSSIDEIVPAGSSLDFVDYQFPDKEESSSFKTNIKSPYFSDSHSIFSSHNKNKYKVSEDYLNSFKNLYTTTPTSISHWGNIFKDSEFSSYKSHPKKPFYSAESNDDIVHIPKRQPSFDFEKYLDNKPNDWGFINDNYKTYKPVSIRDSNDWTKDFKNRFKSEEDLLGLRNHDTSHPSYVPSFKPSYDNFDDDIDFKKLSTKWKQNFLKAKYRDTIREYDTIASEPKPVHVPLPKPYPVRVPVVKPYPVHVPQIRPIFHHTKPHHDEREPDPYEDDYLPDTKRPSTKRQKNSRNRSRPSPRRPSRTPYEDRSRRRVPGRRPASYHDQRQRRPYSSEGHSHHRYRDDFDEYDSDSDFERYCKRTGKC